MASKRILVIEDEPSIADNILYALHTEGFKTEWCRTAQSAEAYLLSNSVDLILLDIGLPDENGFEFARKLRQKGALLEKNGPVPIIFVSARADEIDRILGLELGADDYVVKPFSPRELTARAKAVLRRSTAPVLEADTTVTSGHWLLDEEKVSVKYRGQPLELSRYEFRLLAVLIKRPGRVYSREELMMKAWEEPDMSLERTVDTHIKTIRQKLRLAGILEELVITHRGLGYSLKEE